MRIALRNLRAVPGYTATVVVTLSLAIAIISAIFGAVYAVLLRPLPIRNADALIVGWETAPERAQLVSESAYGHIRDWQNQTRQFEQIAGMGSSVWHVVLEGRGDPVRLASTAVTSSFFDTLGVRPALGRTFRQDDDRLSNGDVVVLAHKEWVQRFGSDPKIVGRTLTLDKRPHTVIGVMPRDFDFPRGTDLWVPVVPILTRLSTASKDGFDLLEHLRVLHLVGRMRPGVDLNAARADLDAVAARRPDVNNKNRRTHVVPLLDHLLGPVRSALWWLMAAGVVLLLVACANVSALTLSRSALKRREHAVRLALGASDGRIARTWLLETTILAVAGGAAGLLTARWVLALLVRLAPDDISRISDATINWPVAGFTLIVVALAALLSAAGAVVHASRTSIGEVLADSNHATASRQSTHVRSGLVVAQIALAVVLLVCASLVVRSFYNLRRLDLGFDPTNVLTLHMDPSAAKRPAHEWFAEVVRRVRHLPGVESAGAVFLRPLAYGSIGTDTSVLLEGQLDPENTSLMAAVEAAARNPHLNRQQATPEYFRTMRIPLLRGRLFDQRDRPDAPWVVVVGERTAQRLWPGQDPIGKKVGLPQQTPDGEWKKIWQTVVGVVKDVSYRGLDDQRLDIYEPGTQTYSNTQFLVVRASGDPMRLVGAVLAEIRDHDRHVVISGITTLDTVVGRAMAPWRLSSWLLALLAGAAFLLALVGLVGLLGLEVAQRAREYALRMALGADARHVRNRVLGSAAARCAAGLIVGVFAALGVTPWLRALLFGITAADFSTYVIVITAVTASVFSASLLPAIRAATTQPMLLLKRD
jgi:putative ABC transport system permease protein